MGIPHHLTCLLRNLHAGQEATFKTRHGTLNCFQTGNFQMFKLDLEKIEKPEIKLPTSFGSLKKQENSRKASTSASPTMLKPLNMWITTNCGKFLEMGITDHLTYLLINLYTGQEATVRTRHGTTEWFKIGKGVCQASFIVNLLT